jgi:large subunit ribosomal protein L9
MEIILLQKINKLGNIGDTVKVKPGFGRNFLIPSGKALRATKENKEIFENTKTKLLEENKEAIEKAEKTRAEVEGLNLVVVRSASDTGMLYGSVTTRDISKLIDEHGVTLSRKQISLENPIKELGIFNLRVILHPEVETKIELRVVRSLGDTAIETDEDKDSNSGLDKVNAELNENLLEDGVSLKADDSISKEMNDDHETENKSAEQS